MNTKHDQATLPPVHHESKEHEVRLQKIEEMRKQGFNPWPSYKPVTATIAQAVAFYEQNISSEEIISLAGRLLTKRDHGKTFFGDIQDRSGKVQIYLKESNLGKTLFDHFKHHVDSGDIIWVTGTLFVTKMGEITVNVNDFSLLSKCLHPLPEKWHGLVDVEQRYRQRYLDLISNTDSREKFKMRSKLVSSIRKFLEDQDFIEVETPMLHPIPGGATARPFVTHHNAYDIDLFLRIAPELYLKRLVVGGFERVFEINRNFRNEGVSTRHNPEFTMLEFYLAHGDFIIGMDLTEKLLRSAIAAIIPSGLVPYNELILDFSKPFRRLSIERSLIEIGGLRETELAPETIDKTLTTHNVHVHAAAGRGAKLFALFEELVEKNIVQPTFITDYPVEVSPLAKRNEQNHDVTDRFELFVAGMELANGFTELNDPFDQAERFKGQVAAREAGDAEAHHFDADYIKALEYALPPTVGVGIGIDRLTMLTTNTQSIKDVILFPTMKSADHSS